MVGAAVAVALLSLSAAAEESWSSVPPIANADLWGVCYGGGQFVAVGAGGTVLGSPDGLTWTRRASGTTEWLLAVAHNGRVFVAVGDHHTILVSSDGIIWRQRAYNGAGPRLNGVAARDGYFVAVGEKAEITVSVDEGETWTSASSSQTGFVGESWLRAAGPDLRRTTGFLVGGQNGILLNVDIPSLAPLELSVTPSAPVATDVEAIAVEASDVMVIAGASALFTVPGTAGHAYENGFGPLRYRGVVSYNHGELVGVAEGGYIVSSRFQFSGFLGLERATAPAAPDLNAVAASPAAVVAVGNRGAILRKAIPPQAPLVIDGSGSANPAYAGDNVQFAVLASGTSPMSYQWSRNGIPIPGATNAFLDLKNVSQVLEGNYTVAITNAYGSATTEFPLSIVYARPPRVVDANFHADLTNPTQVTSLTDGKILVYDNSNPPALVRLNADGSRDASFTASVSGSSFYMDDRGGILIWGQTTEGYLDHLVRLGTDGSVDRSFAEPATLYGTPIALSDGRFVILNGTAGGISIRHFNSDGRVDAASPSSIIPFPWPTDFLSDFHSVKDEAGRVLVLVTATSLNATQEATRFLFRLSSDGSYDRSYPSVAIADELDELVYAGGKLYGRHRFSSDLGPPAHMPQVNIIFTRLNLDGSPDKTYATVAVSWNPLFQYVGATLAPDGSVLIAGEVAIRRYDPDGHADRYFSAQLIGVNTFGLNLHPVSDGTILISSGAFGPLRSIDGVETSGLARIIPVTDTFKTRLVNLSLRASAGTGPQTLIAGFVVTGNSGSEDLLVRGIGPGLASVGVPPGDALRDPHLTLFSGTSAIATNEDWNIAVADVANRVGAFPLPPGSRDAAFVTSLSRGAYTVHVSGADATPGTALIELYDTNAAPTNGDSSRLVNISGRCRLNTADDVLIAGFVISGQSAKRILIRAVGPGLRQLGVTDAMADPQLTIYHGNEVVAANGDWTFTLPMVDLFKDLGAFALDQDSKDAVVVIDLPPGVYTAVACGTGGSPGSVLLEVYEAF